MDNSSTASVINSRNEAVSEGKHPLHAADLSLDLDFSTLTTPSFSSRKAASAYVNRSQSSTVKPQARPVGTAAKRPSEKTVDAAKLSWNAQMALKQLGLNEATVAVSQVKRAFRRLAREHHPDLKQGQAQVVSLELFREYKELSELIIKEINTVQ